LTVNLGQPVVLDWERSVEWANDPDFEKHTFGIKSLFYAHRENKVSWDIFFEILHHRSASDIHPSLIYFLVLIHGHEDIFWSCRNKISDEIKAYATCKIRQLTRDDIIKLLSFIDYNGFERGTIGQSVAHIVLAVENNSLLLESIALDKSIDLDVREKAAGIFLEFQRKGVARFLSRLLETDDGIKKYAQDIIKMSNYREERFTFE
jgi:hypothetical protein